MLISGLALTGVAMGTRNFIPLAQIPAASWIAISYLAIFGSVFAFMAYLYALQNLPTEQASIYSYINPVIAVLLGSWLYNEPLNTYIISGVFVAIVGVYLVNRSFRTRVTQSESQ